LLKIGEPEKAVEELEMTINLDSQYALAYFQLGKAYRQLGNRTRAEECMQKYGFLSLQQKSEEAQRSNRFRESLTDQHQ
jgi:predicted Zn-dependent protease